MGEKERGCFVVAIHRSCVLYDRDCIGCGECDRCDLDPKKICDNCMQCVKGDKAFRSILLDGIRLSENEPDDQS